MQARRITVLALLAGLTLAGCGEDEPEPKVEPLASSTPTPSPTAPVEPTLPPEAEGTSKAAAEAQVQHYYAAINYAQATGDTRRLRSAAHRLCEVCDSGADYIERIYAKGGTIEGGDNTIVSMNATRTGGRPLYTTRIQVRTESTPQVVTGTRSGLDDEFPGGRSTVTFTVVNEKGQWLISDWWVAE